MIQVDPIAAERTFADVLVANGAALGTQIETGRLVRCGTVDKPRAKDFAYLLYLDGVPAGGFQNFRTGQGWQSWCYCGADKIPPAELAAHRERMREIQRAREAATEAMRAEARAKALRIWTEATPCTAHPYLTAKGVQAHGLRVSRDRLVIPARDVNGAIHTLQLIADKRDQRYKREKDFLRGGQVAGHFYVIGETTPTICIAEGFATAATVHEATGYQTIVAFDRGNLLAVARTIRKLHRAAKIVLAADNDAQTQGNPGLADATKAARAVGGYVARPDFTATNERAA